MARNTRGKGWFGDSVGHAKAGRKGGLSRGKRIRENSNVNSSAPKLS